MSLIKAVSKVGILLSLVISAFLVSDATAQDQLCECVDAYDTVAVRAVPVRRAAHRAKAKRVRRSAVRRTTVVRPAYQTVYVPVRRVEYVPRYVAYVDDDDCDDDYDVAGRVYVTERVYTNGNGRKVYYTNGQHRYKTAYVTNRVYTGGNYVGLAVDRDYYATQRIAADYGFRDGFDDGREVAMERETYLPEKEGDFRNGTNGYEDDFGDKDLYKEAYRDAYLRGYNAGWRSIAQSSTYSVVRW